ncbi:TlpA family protein disulfide reductase [Nitrincola tibetensis]|uniref:TlpA family protein disulfide reductase n=1 Tax=Nitrincola tibetensis TaxID=2219697 RepID=A0A364NR57_9GAMM|nr:TlpA disulfide reductase family protein [Nitrincola tibetensis]RAU19365.1 TlpA family protein disulfide reductase [Nitrincola tibetensis]
MNPNPQEALVLKSSVFYLRLPIALAIILSSFSTTLSANGITHSFTQLEGNEVSLNDYKGKVLMVNFWATWCPPCIHEMPAFNRLQQTFSDEPFQIIAINAGETEETVVEFLEAFETELIFPIWLDPEWKGFGEFGLRGLPTTLIFGKDGNLVERVVGEKEWDQPEVYEPIRSLF